MIAEHPSRPLHGRICMVTGATSGIGAATARELARLGATVIVVGRRADRCQREVDWIGRAGGIAEPLVADLSSQREVRRLAEGLAARHGRLDVLVNNAGSLFATRRSSVDGIEMTFAVNHLSCFMLTLLLLGRLGASPSARVVNVSSVAHEAGHIDFENLQGERRWERLDAYRRSKLANLLFTYELARRLGGTRITANALHPGIVATNLGADRGWLRARVRNLLKPGMLTPEQGARTSVVLASSPALEGISGRYYDDCREVPSSAASYDEAAAARLWEISERLTGVRWSASIARAVPS
jgi:NAD(P)-dependent dehydrogenase (short-subunit alcohol dehydrogenase family)